MPRLDPVAFGHEDVHDPSGDDGTKLQRARMLRVGSADAGLLLNTRDAFLLDADDHPPATTPLDAANQPAGVAFWALLSRRSGSAIPVASPAPVRAPGPTSAAAATRAATSIARARAAWPSHSLATQSVDRSPSAKRGLRTRARSKGKVVWIPLISISSRAR